ncbi:glycosyltransferase involved in cell wall biosynthesis [Dongia mobilis]|uniref:Glycosyltransferase involved in cell wall biosynthesis n=1 Tax=Dongia mobilis TaxID=578943 RepID=A0A4R6WF61_9PROT|nr:glycosyltransferase family 4 protein [Dongia mobilis]TDQ78535.1 glycosyltransferase involved in cell wall biosynthesis [Dongia mobilis]
MPGKILFLLKGYPRLSETFIAQEIRALEQRGLELEIWSLRFPTDKHRHPVHGEIQAPVTYLPEYLYQEPWRVLRGVAKASRRPGFWRALRQWGRDLLRDPSTNRGRRFGQACVLAAEMPADTARLHAHFLHTPASVAYYAHLMTGVPWSCSAHAKDIWTSPNWEKREKLKSLDWLVTCTASGHAHLKALSGDPAKVALVYHGLDFNRFPEPPARAAGRRAEILSVGRLVPKKGYPTLLLALSQLPAETDWHLTHIGGGPLEGELKALAETLGIAPRITWRGAQPQEQVLAAYRAADIFVLAAQVAADGDRDGLPNVLMEAQSQRLACIASNISGIPELIRDGETGLLVPPEDARALATALLDLINHPERRRQLAEAGFNRVRAEFSITTGIEDLKRRFAG